MTESAPQECSEDPAACASTGVRRARRPLTRRLPRGPRAGLMSPFAQCSAVVLGLLLGGSLMVTQPALSAAADHDAAATVTTSTADTGKTTLARALPVEMHPLFSPYGARPARAGTEALAERAAPDAPEAPTAPSLAGDPIPDQSSNRATPVGAPAPQPRVG